jgi:hypothetical protein
MELKTYFAQDASGNIMPGATVTVYEAGTATLATGLQDESGSPLANPFTADSYAKVAFYAPDGLYDITVVGNGRTVTIRAQFVSVDGASVLRTDLAATGGSALVGFQQAGTGAASRTPQDELRERISIKQFGAVGDGVADDTAAIAAAHAYAASLPYGATLRIPRGKYNVTALPKLAANVNWQGDGRLASQIFYSGTGNGLAFTTASVNTYTSLRIFVRDMTIACTNAGNTGGGLVLESCAYVEIKNAYFEKFKCGHILDGCSHFRCEYTEIAQQTRAGIWIVNGPERRAGQSKGFTNNIWYGNEIQLNEAKTAGVYALQDDGGVNHDFCGINFNSGDIGARFAGVIGLRYHNNAHESYIQSPVVFTDTSREAGTYVGPCSAVDVRTNTLSNISGFAIVFDALEGGVVEANLFAQMSSSAMTITSPSKVKGLKVAANSKLVTGASRTAAPFFDATFTTAAASVDKSGQAACTYVAAAISSGAQTVTPATMEGVYPGITLVVSNEDGSNAEIVTVSAISAATFTATFASAKAANWKVYGQQAATLTGTWTPTIAGSTVAGANTYTLQNGVWTLSNGIMFVRGYVTLDVKDAAMSGGVLIAGLPAPVQNVSNRIATANFSAWAGLTFPAGYTQLSGVGNPNNANIALRRMGSGQALSPVQASELASGALLIFEMEYPVGVL